LSWADTSENSDKAQVFIGRSHINFFFEERFHVQKIDLFGLISFRGGLGVAESGRGC
jgi:hypothetical protein